MRSIGGDRYEVTLSNHCSTLWFAKKASRPGMTIVATARAAALDVCDQPMVTEPTSLVPTPQKKIAGADSKLVILECLRTVGGVVRWMCRCY